MSDWSPLDWIAYGGLGATALFLAINSGIALPAIRREVPAQLKDPKWGFLPITCFVIATAAFAARLFITPTPQSQNATPSARSLSPSVSSPTQDTAMTDNEAVRHLVYQLSQEINDFYDNYYERKHSISKESSAEQKALDTETMETEMSGKFKEKFKFRYLSLWDELTKRGVKPLNPLNFDQNIISPGDIVEAPVMLNYRARELK